MRVALLGGSFDPPHLGHQMLCLWALSARGFDQVWLVPCYHHAFAKTLSAFEHRAAMCVEAARPFAADRAQVSLVERELGAPTRTLRTVQHLIAHHPDDRFSLLIGGDILAETASWHRFDEIRRLVDVEVVGREGYPAPPGTVVLPGISSTEVRARLARSEAVDHLLPAAVLRYIEAERLYCAEITGEP